MCVCVRVRVCARVCMVGVLLGKSNDYLLFGTTAYVIATYYLRPTATARMGFLDALGKGKQSASRRLCVD